MKDISYIVTAGGDPLDRRHLKLIESTVVPANEPSRDRDRLEIWISVQAHEVIDEAVHALESVPGVYQRGGIPVQVVRDPSPPSGIQRSPGSPRVTPLREPRVMELLASAADWKKIIRGNVVNVLPPQWVVKGTLARDQWQGRRHGARSRAVEGREGRVGTGFPGFQGFRQPSSACEECD